MHSDIEVVLVTYSNRIGIYRCASSLHVACGLTLHTGFLAGPWFP